MKKMITLLVATVMTISLAACGGSKTDETKGTYKEGTYTAEESEFTNDWKGKISIDVDASGNIAAVDWDGVNEAGETKKGIKDDYGLKPVSDIGKEWFEQADAIEKELIKDQDPLKIPVNNEGYPDAVSGCTINVSGFIALSQEALKTAK